MLPRSFFVESPVLYVMTKSFCMKVLFMCSGMTKICFNILLTNTSMTTMSVLKF